MYAHVDSSVIHNRQEVQETQVSTDGGTGKQNVVHTLKGILALKTNFKSLRNAATSYSMDEL